MVGSRARNRHLLGCLVAEIVSVSGYALYRKSPEILNSSPETSRADFRRVWLRPMSQKLCISKIPAGGLRPSQSFGTDPCCQPRQSSSVGRSNRGPTKFQLQDRGAVVGFFWAFLAECWFPSALWRPLELFAQSLFTGLPTSPRIGWAISRSTVSVCETTL